MKICIFGYGWNGVQCYRNLMNKGEFDIIGFADNSVYKQGKMVAGNVIMSMEDLVRLKSSMDFSIVIAAHMWREIGEQLEENNIPIKGIWQEGKVCSYEKMTFEKLDLTKQITLYAGDICDDVHIKNPNLYGLSINKTDERHILADITEKYPLPNDSIFSYQAEDVLEHIEFSKLVETINEIYRILGKGVFRICLPDYFSPYLKEISMIGSDGTILFDPSGGGIYGENGVSKGGHVWFPNINKVKELLEKTKFKNVEYLCYHTEDGQLVRKNIDFSKGYIKRIPEVENEERPVYSIVVDCYK